MKKLIDRKTRFVVRDPDIIYHGGMYYLTCSRNGGTPGIVIYAAPTAEALADAEPVRVYEAPEGTMYSKELWAPELHIIDGKCYIYVACDDGVNKNHRMYVLENGSADPLAPYTLRGKLTDPTDRWAIDGTVFSHNGQLYFLWSGWEGDINVAQNLYLAKMSSPCTIEGERLLLSCPEYEWEKRGATGEPESPFINEGPYACTLGGRFFVTYSASGSWCEHYCIGVLELTGDDPMIAENWKKYDAPLFGRNLLVKGAGHCSMIQTSDTTADLFFHAWDADETDVNWGTVSAWKAELRLENGELLLE